jgi:hypothetical protein
MKNRNKLSRRRFISDSAFVTLGTIGASSLFSSSAGSTLKPGEVKSATISVGPAKELENIKIVSDNKTEGCNMKAGTGRVNITPPIGADTSGNPVIGIKSELFAKALVLDDGQTRAALITADILLLGKTVVSELRKLIEEKTGIPGSNVMIAVSHDHSGPSSVIREAWGSNCNIQPDNNYIDQLITRIAGAVADASSHMTEVKIGVNEGRAPFNINRWIPTPQGPSGAKWGPYPEGPTDETLSVLRIDRKDGTPLAAVINFAAHASVANWGEYISADFPGYLQETIEKVYDGKITVMFINGASGDLKIKWLTNKADGSIDFAYGGEEDARRWGRIIGGTALSVLEQTETTSQPCRITLSGKQVDLPMLPFPSVREIKAQIETKRKSGKDTSWEQRILPLLLNGNTPGYTSGEVQLLRLGNDISLLAIPGELFVEIGLRMRNELGCKHLFIAGYANGYTGYLPTSSSCLADGNNLRYDWHKIFSYPSSFSEGVEPALMSAAKDLFGKQ